MLGLADRGRTLDLFDAIARGDARTAITEVRNQYDSGAEPTLILRDLLDIGHEAARAQALGADARIIGGADWVGRVRGLAEKLSPAQLSRLWQMLLKSLEEAGKAPDPIAAVEMAMVRLCAAQSLPPPEEAARLLRDGPSWTAGASPAETKSSGGKDATINETPPPPKPAGVQAKETPPSPTGLNSFDDVLKLVAAERDIDLEITLEGLKVTRFNPNGEIIFIATPEQPRDLVRRLKSFLEEQTPFEWTIRAVDEAPVAPIESIAERRRREEARKLEELKRQPFVAEALKHFPDAQITAVRMPVEEPPAGDVVQMPQAKPGAPQATRKKEADR
jgi:DNA polymerase-3 subunit gamma/tau